MSRRTANIGGPLFTNKGQNTGRAVLREPYETYAKHRAYANGDSSKWWMDYSLWIAVLWEAFSVLVQVLAAGITLHAIDRSAAGGNDPLPAFIFSGVMGLTKYVLKCIRRHPWLPDHGDPGYTFGKIVQGEMGVGVALLYWIAQFGGAFVGFAILGATASSVLNLGGVTDANQVLDNYTAPYARIPLASAASAFFWLFFLQFWVYFLTFQQADGDYRKIRLQRKKESVVFGVSSAVIHFISYFFGFVSLNSALGVGLLMIARNGTAAVAIPTTSLAGLFFLLFGANLAAGIVAGFVSYIGGGVEGDLQEYNARNDAARAARQ